MGAPPWVSRVYQHAFRVQDEKSPEGKDTDQMKLKKLKDELKRRSDLKVLLRVLEFNPCFTW